MTIKVCIIGAGPCGMLTLCAYNRLRDQGLTDIQVTCYEKQRTPGGLWNLTWRTGVDEFGEPLPNSQYNDLFSNGPKECLEFPDYTFVEHFGKQIPSYPPRLVLKDYLEGYWRKCGVSPDQVKTLHCVRNVVEESPGRFAVTVEELETGATSSDVFDYVIVATGHFSFPNVPEIRGVSNFKGRVLHAHDFRKSSEFVGQDVLFVGSSYSAEDISLQCLKLGAKSATLSYRSKPMAYKMPDTVAQRPAIDRIDEDGNVVFTDGHIQKFDAITLCTGYLTKFPFMPGNLTLRCGNIVYPPNLYRGVQFVDKEGSGQGRVLYLGMYDQWYTFTLFKMQAWWAVAMTKGLLKEIVDVPLKDKLADIAKWEKKAEDMNDDCLFQRDFLLALCEDVGCHDNLDTDKQFREWFELKYTDLRTYRDHGHESNFDKLGRAPVPNTKWWVNYNDSLEAFVDNI